MKESAFIFLIGLFLQQLCAAQPVEHNVSLDIMTTAVNQSSLDSVPLKISVPKSMRLSELTFPVSEEESGDVFITGTPYDSVQVQVPNDIQVRNQYSEHAKLQNFQLVYGASEDISTMEVVSPSGCIAFQIPETGRIHISLGGVMVSDDNLRGNYSGSVRLGCRDKE